LKGIFKEDNEKLFQNIELLRNNKEKLNMMEIEYSQYKKITNDTIISINNTLYERNKD
jgi:hypothetical protein